MLATGLQTRTTHCALAATVRRRWPFGLASRLVVAVVLTAAALGLGPGLAPPPAAAGFTAYVDTDVLNLRAEPGTWSQVLAHMSWGEPVWIIDGPADGWYYVDYYGSQGWAYGDYLRRSPPDPGSQVASSGGSGGWSATAWVATDRLNVRSDASQDAWIIDVASQGDEVTVLGDPVAGFYPVRWWGQRGWVWADYLSFDGPVAAGPEQWIDVDRSSSTVTLMSGDVAIASYWGAMGWDTSADGFYATANGTYYVYAKYQPLNYTEWGNAWITDWVAFDPVRLNGFHSYSRERDGTLTYDGGDEPTGGCIATHPDASAQIYAFASLGTRVEVHW
jgi:uncharacterized protein YgiM (DUF1202 family)